MFYTYSGLNIPHGREERARDIAGHCTKNFSAPEQRSAIAAIALSMIFILGVMDKYLLSVEIKRLVYVEEVLTAQRTRKD
jgi:hypothetical protein